VFWHSTAHVLGEAMERYYGGCLCYGPPIENGFYYDMYHEVRIINEKVDTPTTTAYRCGPLIDLCRGPHVRNTGKIKAFAGAHIYNTLVEMMRQEYRKRGFHEVISPNIFSTRLWDMSGHSGHYLENMFLDRAESQLKAALDGFGHAWSLNEGDGAFYGPKIDIKIEDALRRQHQCATIQLDFNLPERFDLSYADVERCIAMLTEHFGGKWPFWLSPRQLYAAGFEAEVNIASNDTFNKKIRNAQLDQFNFILVVGEKEAENGTVNVRTRDNKVRQFLATF
ncbi:unnamed protein product, partial [Sphagnum balticum]